MQKKVLQKHQVSKMLFLSLFLMSFSALQAQEDPKVAARTAQRYMQEAEAARAEDDLASAEAFYRKAIATDPSNAEAKYNLGNLYYDEEIAGQAVERHGQAANVTEKKSLKHDAFHNRGNAFMKQKKYKEAIEAYKNSLRNNPGDDQTRYNLALAKKMLEEQQKNGGDKNQDQKKDQNKDKQDQNKDQQDKKDQQGDQGEKEKNDEGKPQDEKDKGGEKQDQDKKEGQDKKDDEGKPQNKDQQQQDKGGEKKDEQQKQPQPQPGQLSPQQVKNLLEAMGNEEKKIQDKINAQKVKGAKTRTEKDW